MCRSFYRETKIIEWSLVGISPSDILVFLSSCYGGRASDKITTKDGNFYDFLERDDLVMGDRSFQFKKYKRGTKDKRFCELANSC